MKPASLPYRPDGYADWLLEVKARVQAAQQRAAFAVNQELLARYWQLGRDILDRQACAGWGAGVVEQVATDLRAAFPEMKGFSRSNLMYMRGFAGAWTEVDLAQQPVGRLPWGHNLYQKRAPEHRPDQSDLARETLKDLYRFDFLAVGVEVGEREREGALVAHITRFLLELGAGFAFVGRQVHLEVGGDDFFLDLLFYHLKLRCDVVVELKAGPFKPEHTGQLAFYLSAVDAQVKTPADAPTIGILLCKSKNKIVAEYAPRSTDKPIGVAEDQLVESLPDDLEASLPSVEQIERELGEIETPVAGSEGR
jgi:predicted nuclease of restriction endonuclease-like (RecB) superfamily